MSRNRHCCDGLCQQGRHCPLPESEKRYIPLRLAPGVIDGPHLPRRGVVRRCLDRTGALLARIVAESCA